MQVEGFVNGTFNLARTLPEELAALPKNVSFCAHSCLYAPTCADAPDAISVCTDTGHSLLESTWVGCSDVLRV